jgi:predicted GH43/DUF377 family glycosyl hydrolase
MVRFERLGVVLAPDQEYQAKFNAGMIAAGDTVHMLYRFAEKRRRWYGRDIDWAQYERDREFPYVKNYICYAQLGTDGSLRLDSNRGVIVPDNTSDTLGCEDPRIVPFEGAYYVFYCAYDGVKPRVAIATTLDFTEFRKLGAIDHAFADKDAFIFPERISGKVAYMHRVPPSIQIDYFDSIEALLRPESWQGYETRVDQQTVLRGIYPFEERKIGGGVPPIKTEHGWLLIYHGVDAAGVYATGAALLDLDDPGKVIARLPYSVLSPEADFETQGDYRGCVFAQGYFIADADLFISYGTADKYTAMARVRLDELLGGLLSEATR